MSFDPTNSVVQLCAKGMDLEGTGRLAEAEQLFRQAWDAAANDFEKFIAAHYVARQQKTIEEKMKWDEIALKHAIKTKNEDVKSYLPSLYLNIGKCYENLNQREKARTNYQKALSFVKFLPADGYGNMIKSGVANGMSRTK